MINCQLRCRSTASTLSEIENVTEVWLWDVEYCCLFSNIKSTNAVESHRVEFESFSNQSTLIVISRTASSAIYPSSVVFLGMYRKRSCARLESGFYVTLTSQLSSVLFWRTEYEIFSSSDTIRHVACHTLSSVSTPQLPFVETNRRREKCFDRKLTDIMQHMSWSFAYVMLCFCVRCSVIYSSLVIGASEMASILLLSIYQWYQSDHMCSLIH